MDIKFENVEKIDETVEDKSVGGVFGFEKDAIIMIIKALFLLILSISGNFLAEMLGCQTQKFLSNMYTKHLLLYFLISHLASVEISLTVSPNKVLPLISKCILISIVSELLGFNKFCSRLSAKPILSKDTATKPNSAA